MVELTWKLVALFTPPSASEFATYSKLPITQEHNSPQFPKLSSIVSLNLFGASIPRPSSANTKPARSQPISVSKLNIRLLGTITGNNAGNAAIVVSQGKQRAYVVGEDIPTKSGNVRVVDVLSDHMVISRAGTAEIVHMIKRQTGLDNGIARIPTSELSADLNTPTVHALIGNLKQTLRTTPLSLKKFFVIQPVNEQGRLKGYQLKAGTNPRLFRYLKLESNDLLTEVNGEHVSKLSLKQVSQLFADNDTLNITLLRNSIPLSFSVSL